MGLGRSGSGLSHPAVNAIEPRRQDATLPSVLLQCFSSDGGGDLCFEASVS